MSASAQKSVSGDVASPGSATPAELEAFYLELFVPLVRRAAWAHGLESEDARDVVQEAFLLAIAKLDARRNPRAWLTRVVDHLSRNHAAKLSRRARLEAKWGLGRNGGVGSGRGGRAG